jgi:hypothetical protein
MTEKVPEALMRSDWNTVQITPDRIVLMMVLA